MIKTIDQLVAVDAASELTLRPIQRITAALWFSRNTRSTFCLLWVDGTCSIHANSGRVRVSFTQ